MPPLLNDFISLQKDVALVSILGPLEAFRVAQIDASSNFNYTPLLAAARAVPVRDDPAGARASTACSAAGGAMTAPSSRSAASRRPTATPRCCAASTSSVPEHGAVALIGASGSGKSTLLRCIDLLEEIDDGDVLLDGEVITDPSVEPVAVRRRLGMVFQAFNLFPHLTVLENVVLGAGARAGRRARGGARRGRASCWRASGSAGREDERPDRLSGGQQQRVAIVRALATAAARAAARRGHERARPRARRRGARRRPRPQGARA